MSSVALFYLIGSPLWLAIENGFPEWAAFFVAIALFFAPFVMTSLRAQALNQEPVIMFYWLLPWVSWVVVLAAPFVEVGGSNLFFGFTTNLNICIASALIVHSISKIRGYSLLKSVRIQVAASSVVIIFIGLFAPYASK
jgi:hypothetical protein